MPKEFVEHMVPLLKNALVTSLHQVFVYGLVFVLLGAVLTLFVGNIKLSDRKKKKEDDGEEENQVSPHLA
ncbi:hypothetical protein D3C84_1220960 [compost metagenome]